MIAVHRRARRAARQPGWATHRRLWPAGLAVLIALSTVTLAVAAPAFATTHVAAGPPPGQPGRPTVVAGDGEVTVTIVPPATTGVAVSSYFVRDVDDAGNRCVVNNPTVSPSCEIDGLYNGLAYIFESVAFSSSGAESVTSAYSVPVMPLAAAIVTPSPTATPAPTTSPTGSLVAAPAVVSLVAGTSSLISAWAPVPGATSYTVTAHPGPATCTVVATSCVLGAVAGTPYRVTVVAHAAAGDSAASLASIAVTPLAPDVPTSPPMSAPATLTTDHGLIGVAGQGQPITLVGAGFAPFSTVRLTLYSAAVDLGNVTTTALGGFTQPIVVPTSLAAGAHTLLASGVDPQGSSRLIARPLAVVDTEVGSSGPGAIPLTVRLPIPPGGAVTLLDEAGLPDTVLTLAAGTYTLDPATGVISFVAAPSFSGIATSVRYRITDAIGTVVNGIDTAVVTSPLAGTPLLKLPGRILTSTAAPVDCAISTGSIARCVVTLTADVSGQTVPIGYGVATPDLAQDLQKVTVQAVLNELGRYLAARPGGIRSTVGAELIQRGVTRHATAKASTELLARTFTLSRSIAFAVNSHTVSRTDASYLTATSAKLGPATAITCAGHADSTETGRSTLGARRAAVTCAILAKTLAATIHTTGEVDAHPTGDNNTPAGRALNRRVTVTITN